MAGSNVMATVLSLPVDDTAYRDLSSVVPPRVTTAASASAVTVSRAPNVRVTVCNSVSRSLPSGSAGSVVNEKSTLATGRPSVTTISIKGFSPREFSLASSSLKSPGWIVSSQRSSVLAVAPSNPYVRVFPSYDGKLKSPVAYGCPFFLNERYPGLSIKLGMKAISAAPGNWMVTSLNVSSPSAGVVITYVNRSSSVLSPDRSGLLPGLPPWARIGTDSIADNANAVIFLMSQIVG